MFVSKRALPKKQLAAKLVRGQNLASQNVTCVTWLILRARAPAIAIYVTGIRTSIPLNLVGNFSELLALCNV